MKYSWILFLLIAQSAWGQYKDLKKPIFELPLGIQWQSTYMNNGWENFNYPTIVEQNIQGFGLRFGGKMRILKKNYISFVPAFRYDYVYTSYVLDTLTLIATGTKRFEPIVDIHAGIERRFGKHYVGLVTSFHNLGKSFTFRNPTIPIFVDMRFKSTSFMYGYCFKNGLSAEFRFIVTQKAPNIAYIKNRRFLMLNFSAYYNLLRLLKEKRK